MCDSFDPGRRLVTIQVGENNSILVHNETFPGGLVKLIVRQLKEDPNKVVAIKLVRMMRPIGLYEAKAFVEFLQYTMLSLDPIAWQADSTTLYAVRNLK